MVIHRHSNGPPLKTCNLDVDCSEALGGQQWLGKQKMNSGRSRKHTTDGNIWHVLYILLDLV